MTLFEASPYNSIATTQPFTTTDPTNLFNSIVPGHYINSSMTSLSLSPPTAPNDVMFPAQPAMTSRFAPDDYHYVTPELPPTPESIYDIDAPKNACAHGVSSVFKMAQDTLQTPMTSAPVSRTTGHLPRTRARHRITSTHRLPVSTTASGLSWSARWQVRARATRTSRASFPSSTRS